MGSQSQGGRANPREVSIRPLVKGDLITADHIFRLAFGTFLGIPEPTAFGGDADLVSTRWRGDPTAAFVAEIDGEVVGSNLAANWGSLGTFGPLSVRPDLWDGGIARRLLDPTMELFTAWGTKHAGLFTFPQSAKHIGLYQRYGFYPRFLTAIMAMAGPTVSPAGDDGLWTKYSDVPEGDRDACLGDCRRLTDSVLEGLDLSREIRAVAAQGLGETLLLRDDSRLVGMAICHGGPGSEAGSDTCYVKFAAAAPTAAAGETFERLVDACRAYAAGRGLSRLLAGVNTAREDAYRRLLARGFRTEIQGVIMQRPNEPAYNRPDRHVLDDWR